MMAKLNKAVCVTLLGAALSFGANTLNQQGALAQTAAKLDSEAAMALETQAFAKQHEHDYAAQAGILERVVPMREKQFDANAYKKAHAKPLTTELTSPKSVDSEQYLVDLNQLGWAYQRLGKFNQALANFQKALQINEKVLGSENTETLNSLNQLAICQWRAEKLKDAESNALKLVALQKKVLGPDSNQLIFGLNTLFHVYEDENKNKEAEDTVKEQLRIAKLTTGSKSVMVANVLEAYAELLRRSGQTAQAKSKEEEARGIRAATKTSPEHPVQAKILSK